MMHYRRVRPLEDSIDIGRDSPAQTRQVAPIRHEAPRLDLLAPLVDRGEAVPGSELDDRLHVAEEKRRGEHEQGVGPLARDPGKRAVVVTAPDLGEDQRDAERDRALLRLLGYASGAGVPMAEDRDPPGAR